VTQTVTRQDPTRTRSSCDTRQPPKTATAPRPARPKAPPRHKLALVTWLGAYGVITGLLALLEPIMSTWPLPLRTLLLSVLMVVTLTWVVLPTLNKAFRGWLTS
jgi:antibiotic biosynthesis monooxygenase (ABM) superfamily enzyme